MRPLAYTRCTDCHVIAVDPKYQGRKAGALLVQWGVDIGEATGLPVYFESSPSTVNLYRKMGFEVLPEEIVHKAENLGTEADIEVPLMVRMPSAAGGISFTEWRNQGFPKFDSMVPRYPPQGNVGKAQGSLVVDVVEVHAAQG